MRTLLVLAALLLASGAHAQTDSELLESLMIMADLEAAEAGLTTVHEVEVATYQGFTGLHEFELEADVEYFLVVGTLLGKDLDPDIYIEDPEFDTVVSSEEPGEGEAVRFTTSIAGMYTLNVEVYNCDTDDCPYAFSLYRE